MIKALATVGLLVGSLFMAAQTGNTNHTTYQRGDIDVTRYLITAPPTSTTTPPVATTTTVVAITAQAVIDTPTGKRCGKDINIKLKEYGLPINPFSYIAYRESRCNPNAINAKWNAKGEMVYALNKNKSWDSGLLQINSIHIKAVRQLCGKEALLNHLEGLRNIDCNLLIAQQLYNNGKGIGHWRATSRLP